MLLYLRSTYCTYFSKHFNLCKNGYQKDSRFSCFCLYARLYRLYAVTQYVECSAKVISYFNSIDVIHM